MILCTRMLSATAYHRGMMISIEQIDPDQETSTPQSFSFNNSLEA